MLTCCVHQGLVVVFVDKKVIKFYDSAGASGRVILGSVFRYVNDEHRRKKSRPLEDGWRLVGCDPAEMPQQENGDDCGVFACAAADFIAGGRPLIFDQGCMDAYRLGMVQCIRLKGIPFQFQIE